MLKLKNTATQFGSGFALRKRALERLLRNHDAQLVACRRLLREELPAAAADVTDEVEDGMDHVARAVGAALLEASACTVRGIERALRRLHAGRYGTCEDCGQAIPKLRLRVLPFAERCIACQESRDQANGYDAPLHA